MKVDFSIDWGDVVAYVLFTVFYVTVVCGLATIAWELDQIRTDTSPQRVEVKHVFQQQPKTRLPFKRSTVEL